MKGWWKDTPLKEVLDALLPLTLMVYLSIHDGGYLGGVLMGIAITCVITVIWSYYRARKRGSSAGENRRPSELDSRD